MSKGSCPFCGTENIEIKYSHIIPKLVATWIKKTLPIPNAKLVSEQTYNKYDHSIMENRINVRQQDITAVYLLCEECELLFSQYEKVLKEHYIDLIPNEPISISKNNFLPDNIIINFDEKNNELKICLLSIIWRSLYISKPEDYLEKDLRFKEAFLNSIKQQIKDGCCKENIYIAPINTYNSTPSNYYALSRSINNAELIFSDDPYRQLIILKLPFAFFYIPLGAWNDVDNDMVTKLEGTIDLFQVTAFPSYIYNYIDFLVEQFENMRRNMSDARKKKINSMKVE